MIARATRPAWTRFEAASRDPERAQLRRLRSIVSRAVGLEGVSSLREFRRRAPVQAWDTLAPATERIANGEPAVFTRDSVVAVELSSGSTGARKLVPFTEAGLAEYAASAQAWLHDLCRAFPAVDSGKHYWSLSPSGRRPSITAGGLPVGVHDARFLGAAGPIFANQLAVSPDVARHDLETCRRLTREALIHTPRLALLSVWSPTFLDFLADVPPETWPELAVISAWSDAASAGPAEALARRFPGVHFQPKGLMATEGGGSFPVHGAPAPVVAVSGHFLEFEEPSGRCRMAHELAVGQTYAPVLTTSSGLRRYRLGDLVRVEGWYHRAPCVRFVGRTDGRVDLAGEKLEPVFVGEVLERVRRPLGLRWTFAMLAPETLPRRYVLFVDAGHEELARRVEEALGENPHYAYCRALGQLAPLEVALVSEGARRAEGRYVADGGRAGDFKLTPLDPRLDWRGWLQPAP